MRRRLFSQIGGDGGGGHRWRGGSKDFPLYTPGAHTEVYEVYFSGLHEKQHQNKQNFEKLSQLN